MAISRLIISNFRNLIKVDISPLTQGFNIFYGNNGSGKTSLLETIYYLGHRRSLRNTAADCLPNHHAHEFVVFAEVGSAQDKIVPMGIQRSRHGVVRVKIAGQETHAIADSVTILPMRLINVHSHQALFAAPAARRKYLDWGAFYYYANFQEVWVRFKKTLQQRNAVLKNYIAPEVRANWDQQLIVAAQAFHELRANYVLALLPQINHIFTCSAAELFDIAPLKFAYYPGWPDACAYADLLLKNLAYDLAIGYTKEGPHRADLLVNMAHALAKDILSAGQQKLLVCAMILAQGRLFERRRSSKLLYLVDDLPAELDSHSRKWLLRALAAQQAQIFVTVVEEKVLDEMLATIDGPIKLFHVKHGEINEMTG